MYVHHIAITVHNLEDSINFYIKVFGFKKLNQFEKGNSKFVYLALDDFQLELWEFNPVNGNDDLESLDTIGIRHLAFAVPDIDAVVSNAKALGADLSDPKMGSSGKCYALAKDCNGIALELLEVR